MELRDIKGNLINIGDEIAFVNNNRLSLGRVEKICSSTLKVKWANSSWSRFIQYRLVDSMVLLLNKTQNKVEKEVKNEYAIPENFLL